MKSVTAKIRNHKWNRHNFLYFRVYSINFINSFSEVTLKLRNLVHKFTHVRPLVFNYMCLWSGDQARHQNIAICMYYHFFRKPSKNLRPFGTLLSQLEFHRTHIPCVHWALVSELCLTKCSVPCDINTLSKRGFFPDKHCCLAFSFHRTRSVLA